ncbi:MAG: sugar phosphate isomerase/epimerase [Chitinophagaceae bacterium]|nr:sugar phosphate isomerase/epimerase [Chitinophagaceae bacterium]
MISRRSFIKQTGLFSLAAFTDKSSFYKARGNVGIQLYTLRSDIAKNAMGTISKVAALGYKEVESFGYKDGKYFGMTPAAFAAFLKSNNLSHPSSHYSLAGIEADPQKVMDDAKTAGQKYLVVASIPGDMRKTADDYKKTAARFNKVGALCKKSGLRFGYHNHDFEFKDLDGHAGYEILLKETDPALVTFELDIYWASFADKDPLDMFRQYNGRFELWHVKDMVTQPKKTFTEVGNGVIDYKKIFAAAKQSGMKHYFVEQDVCPGPPLESAEKSIDYIRKNLVK